MQKRRLYIAAIIFITLVITYLHYTSSPNMWPVHSIYMDLYYIPVLIGAMAFGLRGALLTYLLVACLYLPYVFLVWHFRSLLLAEDLLHTLFFGLFAFVAGFFVDRADRYHREAAREHYLAGLGQAATALAHDLQNPLLVIAACLKQIQRKPEKTDEAVQGIAHAAQRMESIVRDTLDFSKPMKLTLAEEDLGTIVRESMESCRLKASEKQVRLTLHVPQLVLSATVDAPRLERAFTNLITNAVDASESGQEVIAEARPAGAGYIVTIKDEGVGMDAETVRNIFIPFYSRKTTGTGMGMAIAKKIIEEHNGTIRIESTPRKGTEVRMLLPRNIRLVSSSP